ARQRRPEGAWESGIRMAAHYAFHVLHFGDTFLERGDQTAVKRKPAGHHHHIFGGSDRFEELGKSPRHREVNAFENIGGGNAARNHVDDVRFGEYRADAADDLRIVGLARKRPDLILGNPQIAGDVLEELARTGGALARHLVAQNLAAFIDADGASVERTDIESRPRLRIKVNRTARVGGHRVEMTGVERYAFPFACGCNVVDIF